MPRTKGAENKNKDKNKKPEKDRDAPKKGKSAFFFFLAANLDDLKKKNVSLAHKEAVSELSKEWKKLSTNGKKPYIELANKEKERFQKEKEVYQAKKQRENEGGGSVNEKRTAKKGVENEPKVVKKEKVQHHYRAHAQQVFFFRNLYLKKIVE